ncbi:hypothetical protein FRC07_006115 [Ceratobasidium sp. 392]|nr:hypothetical protein FRC07_006115 [Ceratobasidium sp. 392]
MPIGKISTNNLVRACTTLKTPYPISALDKLLTKNLTNIEADWRSGTIKISIHLRYKLDLARPRNWQPPVTTAGFQVVDVNPKPPDPLQFRKLVACRDSGVPIKLLATRDFPLLPAVDAKIELDDGTTIDISSDKWRNGLVVLGFFWAKKVEEDVGKHVFKGELDLETGKCAGEAHWNFEFQSCDSGNPPWWCPLGDDSESESSWGDGDELCSAAKKPRVDSDDRLLGEEMDLDYSDEMDSRIYAQNETKNEIGFPEWHRKAHTKPLGPIGTLHRLDDEGHSYKTGLHALAAREPENGMTCVKYWLADPPLPILAEIGRVKPAKRGAPPRPAPRPSGLGTPLTNPAPWEEMRRCLQRLAIQGYLGIRHPNLLDLPDRVFSEFASEVRMERQIIAYSVLHTSGPAVGWDLVPNCVYNAHKMLVDMQCYGVDEHDHEQNQFNQSVFVVGSGGNGANAFKMVHRAEDGPVGYMVL